MQCSCVPSAWWLWKEFTVSYSEAPFIFCFNNYNACGLARLRWLDTGLTLCSFLSSPGCRIHGTLGRFFSSLFSFRLMAIVLPLFHANIALCLICVISLTRQHFVASSAYKFGCLSATRHSAVFSCADDICCSWDYHCPAYWLWLLPCIFTSCIL